MKTIKAGQWLLTEGKTPYFKIYRILKGKISIYKGGKKIREVEIKEGMNPIMPGVTAVLGDAQQHTASVKAETDIDLEEISVDQVRGILGNELPKSIKQNISIMTKAIANGNEITRMVNEFSDLPRVELEIPNDLSPLSIDVLSEIERLYKLITADMENLLK